jgi:hypothetical protein
MIYTENIVIPKDTKATSPILKRLNVTRGLVYKIEIEFPPGPEGTTHIVINDGGFQVWPTTPGVDFSSDSYTISFDDTYMKTVDPLEFQIYGFNTDLINAHTVQVRIGMVSKDIFMARFLPTMTYDYMLKMIKQMEEEEEQRTKEFLKKPFSWLEGVK